MADDPENLVLRHLQGIRESLDAQGKVLDQHGKVLDSIARESVQHSMHLESLEERFEMLREGTMSAIGFAAHADRQYKGLKDQVSDLVRRVEKLEKSK